MASNEQAPPKGLNRRLVGLAVLMALALIDVAALYYLRHGNKHEAAPPVPGATAPQSNAAVPEFDVVRVDAQGNAVLAGRAAPGAVVTIKDGAAVLGTVTADSLGAFVLVPENPLPPGAQEISLAEKLPDGTLVQGVQTADVNVPGNAGAALAVLSGPNGSTLLSGQGVKPGTLGMGTVDYDSNGQEIFSGTAPAGVKVDLRLDGKEVGQVRADAQGRWRLTARVAAATGMLSVNAVDASGAALKPVTVPFAHETLRAALDAGHIVITPGDNLWIIARHVYGHGIMYTLIYTANSGQIHDPNLIFPGQAFVLPKQKN
jgi:nucleoid-associated protein YgaU